jgi:hypothetical protein
VVRPSLSQTRESSSDLQLAPAPETPLDPVALLGEASDVGAKMPVKYRRPRDEGKPKAVVDHGEPAGGQ